MDMGPHVHICMAGGTSPCIPFLDQLLKKTNSTRTARLRMLGRQLYTSFLQDTARPPCESHVAFRHDAAHDGDTKAQGVSQGTKQKALVFEIWALLADWCGHQGRQLVQRRVASTSSKSAHRYSGDGTSGRGAGPRDPLAMLKASSK